MYDPQGRRQAEPLMSEVTWCESAVDACEGADGVAVLTEWNEFRARDLAAARARMKGNALVDLRNIFSRTNAKAAGFSYRGNER